MNCEEAKKNIPLAVGGDGPQVGGELGSHLETCPTCRREWETFTRMRETLREAGEGTAPVTDDEFLRGVYRRAGRASLARPGTGALRWALRASAAAAIVLSLVVALVLTGGRTETAEEEAGRDAGEETTVTRSGTRPVTALPPVEGSELFGLADAGPAEEGHDVLLETEVVPEPRRPEGSEEDAFPLQEVIPVSDAEVCADF